MSFVTTLIDFLKQLIRIIVELAAIATGAILFLLGMVGYFTDETADDRNLAVTALIIGTVLIVGGLISRKLRKGRSKKKRYKQSQQTASRPTRGITGLEPTEKQLAFANRLGLNIDPSMDRTTLSIAIDVKLGKLPATALENYQKVTALVQRWETIADKHPFILAIYRMKNEIMVDVLQVNSAEIDNNHSVVLEVDSPNLRNDTYIGRYLDWDSSFELKTEDLLHHEVIRADFGSRHEEDLPEYEQLVKQGLKTAKKLRRK